MKLDSLNIKGPDRNNWPNAVAIGFVRPSYRKAGKRPIGSYNFVAGCTQYLVDFPLGTSLRQDVLVFGRL